MSANTNTWKASYPFQVDYNDHFETPKQSYVDILPLVDAIGSSLSLDRSNLIIYDPFYCNGLAKANLQSLGFTNVLHEKRDFYNDVHSGKVPFHHILVTNPPYSDEHKERIVKYAIKRLRSDNAPCFLLMPNYVAVKEYYRAAIKPLDSGEEDPLDVIYVLPATKYHYHHPEGTGKSESPFESIWYCFIPQSLVSSAIDSFISHYEAHGDAVPRLVRSVDDLKLCHAVPTIRRRNPKRRRKEKARLAHPKASLRLTGAAQQDLSMPSILLNHQSPKRKAKLSIYRDEKGLRKKRRF